MSSYIEKFENNAIICSCPKCEEVFDPREIDTCCSNCDTSLNCGSAQVEFCWSGHGPISLHYKCHKCEKYFKNYSHDEIKGFSVFRCPKCKTFCGRNTKIVSKKLLELAGNDKQKIDSLKGIKAEKEAKKVRKIEIESNRRRNPVLAVLMFTVFLILSSIVAVAAFFIIRLFVFDEAYPSRNPNHWITLIPNSVYLGILIAASVLAALTFVLAVFLIVRGKKGFVKRMCLVIALATLAAFCLRGLDILNTNPQETLIFMLATLVIVGLFTFFSFEIRGGRAGLLLSIPGLLVVLPIVLAAIALMLPGIIIVFIINLFSPDGIVMIWD